MPHLEERRATHPSALRTADRAGTAAVTGENRYRPEKASGDSGAVAAARKKQATAPENRKTRTTAPEPSKQPAGPPRDAPRP